MGAEDGVEVGAAVAVDMIVIVTEAGLGKGGVKPSLGPAMQLAKTSRRESERRIWKLENEYFHILNIAFLIYRQWQAHLLHTT